MKDKARILIVEDEPNNKRVTALLNDTEVIKAKFNGLIQKPINPGTIMDEIKKILDDPISSGKAI